MKVEPVENNEGISAIDTDSDTAHKQIAIGNLWGEVIEDESENVGDSLNCIELPKEEFGTDHLKFESIEPTYVDQHGNCRKNLSYIDLDDEECKIESKNIIAQMYEQTKAISTEQPTKYDENRITHESGEEYETESCPNAAIKKRRKKSEQSDGANPKKLFHHCPECSYKTSYKCNLPIHINNKHTASHLAKWLYCAHCSYKCKLRGDLNKHVACRHSESRLYKCTKCDWTTKTAGLLRTHVICKHTPANFNWLCCEHCSYKAKFSRYLQQHILRRHMPEDSVKWLNCDQCSYKTIDNNHFRRHLSTVHDSNRCRDFVCVTCNSHFSTKRRLKSHMLSDHKS